MQQNRKDLSKKLESEERKEAWSKNVVRIEDNTTTNKLHMWKKKIGMIWTKMIAFYGNTICTYETQ